MNKKIIIVSALVVLLAIGFLYVNSTYLSANDKDGKQTSKRECTNSGCTQKSSQSSNTENKDIKAGGETGTYDFVTDKACCDEMKSSLQKNIMSIGGVKDVKFGSTCSVSKMTQVTIYYSAGETNGDKIAAYVKDKSYDCSGKECIGKGCDKDGNSSGKSSEQMKQSSKSGCPNGCKNCAKNKNGKGI